MLDTFLSAATTNAKLVLAAAAGAALVAGGSAVAITNVADSGDTGSTVSASDTATAGIGNGKGKGAANRSDTSTAVLKGDRPSGPVTFTAPSCADAENHGKYVSGVARTSTLTGRARGKAVSEAAHTDCGKPAGATVATGADDESATGTEPAKPAKPAKPAAGNPADVEQGSGPGSTGSERREGPGRN